MKAKVLNIIFTVWEEKLHLKTNNKKYYHSILYKILTLPKYIITTIRKILAEFLS